MEAAMTKLKRMSFNLSEQEAQKLEAYADSLARTKTEILRELIRGLPEPAQSQQVERKEDK
jgi:predicted DNA-binding protein